MNVLLNELCAVMHSPGEDGSVHLYAVTRNQTAVYDLKALSKVAALSACHAGPK